MTTRAPASNDCYGLSASIVVYRPDVELLSRTFASLARAGRFLASEVPDMPMRLYVVDNGGLPEPGDAFDLLASAGIGCTLISGHGNVGYGRGHNLAIRQAASRYHLILNPDVEIEASALASAVAFMNGHAEAGLLTPAIMDDDGKLQFLCRRYPTLIDLFVRGFMPGAVRRLFDRRLARYEMRVEINERETLWDPPIVSGCFMLFRTDILKRLDGFDPRYFLYFEDYDLSLRTHALARIVYLPAARVLHHGGGAARKGGTHVRLFVVSAFRFFNRFGWKLL